MSVTRSDSVYRRACTGVAGLDEILGGGGPRDQVYVVEGDPGLGKTTLALQFLLGGARRGECVLYITLSETENELRGVAASHGWTLDGVHVFELKSKASRPEVDAEYTLFHPSEVELSQVMDLLLREVARVRPRRVVFDSLSEIRLLAPNPLSYRRQILALKRHFADSDCTALLLDDQTHAVEAPLQSVAHGVLRLELATPVYGAARRRLRVVKLRGVDFLDGYNDYKLVIGGLHVHPRLSGAAAPFEEPALESPPSGIGALDQLLGGGIDRGTSTLLIGPAGAGKSSLALQYVDAASRRGEPCAMYIFDETRTAILTRALSLGLSIREGVDAGRIKLRHVDPVELSPGELVHEIREDVARRGVRVVLVDSLNGYLDALPAEDSLINLLHELLTDLDRRGVATLLVAAQSGLVDRPMQTPIDISYLADAVVLRFFEATGRVRKAISVLKKRSGVHEDTIHELAMGPGGLSVGPPLQDFRGVLTGVPAYAGSGRALIGGGSRGAGV